MKRELMGRAVSLWANSLMNPTFDNGDDSDNGVVMKALGESLQNTLADENGLSLKIEIFKESLTEILSKKLIGTDRSFASLSSDYEPTRDLKLAAEAARIDKKLFSIKSSVTINGSFVTSSFGYASATLNHYPMPDGKWLVTTLTGENDDILKLITHAMSGNEMKFLIEE